MKSHNRYQKKRVNPIELRKNVWKYIEWCSNKIHKLLKIRVAAQHRLRLQNLLLCNKQWTSQVTFWGKNWSERSECASEPTMWPLYYRHYHFLLSFSPCSLLFSFAVRVKGKIWSNMKLHRLVVCVKDRQSAIFVKAKTDFLT